jgi:hypothetical protein
VVRFGHSIRALALASDEAFASINNLGDRPHFYFYTPFQDGSVVLTNDSNRNPADTDGFIHGGIPGGSPAGVLELHRKRVETMRGRHHEPYETFNRDTRTKASHAWNARPEVAKLHTRIAGRLLRSFLVCLAFLTFACVRVYLIWR